METLWKIRSLSFEWKRNKNKTMIASKKCTYEGYHLTEVQNSRDNKIRHCWLYTQQEEIKDSNGLAARSVNLHRRIMKREPMQEGSGKKMVCTLVKASQGHEAGAGPWGTTPHRQQSPMLPLWWPPVGKEPFARFPSLSLGSAFPRATSSAIRGKQTRLLPPRWEAKIL